MARVEGKILFKGELGRGNAILITKSRTFRFQSFQNLAYLIDSDTKLLRETLSYIVFNDETKIIPEDDFYFDKWDLSDHLLDLDKFIEKTKNYKGKYRIFEIDGDQLLFISEKEVVDRNDYGYSSNNHIDETEVYTFQCDNAEKLDMLYRMLKADVNTAIIKCAMVAFDHKVNGDDLYRHFQLDTGKKIREIYAPLPDVKEALRHLLIVLNPCFENRRRKTNQFAYRPKHSIKDNVYLHANNKYVVKTDITLFFDNCTFEDSFKYIEPVMFDTRYKGEKYHRHTGRHDNLVNEITKLLRPMIINPDTGGLYMGSPVSGVLSNLIMRPAALYLQNIFKKKNLAMSVYADDITVSSDKPLNPNYVVETIKFVFDHYYLPFELKDSKTRYLKNNGRRITGIRINHEDKLTIDRSKYKLVRSILDNLKKGNSITMDYTTLEGRLNYYLFIDDTGKFKRLYTKYLSVLEEKGIHVSIKGQLEM